MSTDYVASVSDENLWLVATAIEFSRGLDRLDESTDVLTARFGDFIDFLIDNFALKSKLPDLEKFQEPPLVIRQAA